MLLIIKPTWLFYIGVGFGLCSLSLVMLITYKARIEMEIGVAGSLGVT